VTRASWTFDLEQCLWHAMHAVDTQSWGELVEAARTVVMTVW
jgi:hypothetical protein